MGFIGPMNRFQLSLAVVCLTSAFSPALSAQRGSSGQEKASNILQVPTVAGIAWFGTWEEGVAEATRTGRPILLMSATPKCNGVPGMW